MIRAAQFPNDWVGMHAVISRNWAETGALNSIHVGDLYWRSHREPEKWFVCCDKSGEIVGMIQYDSDDDSADIVTVSALRGSRDETFMYRGLRRRARRWCGFAHGWLS